MRRRGAARLLDPLIVGVAAAIVAGLGVTVPALWRDEAASVSAATRSWAALDALVGRVDVVHALYYAGLHVWFDVVGFTPFTLRLPSVLAVGGTAAIVSVLGRRLAGRAAGLAAGGVSAVLPSLVWAGGEGRSYALTALLAAGATLALLHALGPHRTRWGAAASWAAHAALLAAGAALFLDALLLPVAHAVTGALLGRGWRRGAPAGSAAVASVAVAPLIAAAARQTAQIGWIPAYAPPSPWHQVLVEQWFRSDAVATAVLVVVLLGALRAGIRRRRPGATAAVALPWAVLPTGALLAAGLVSDPLYWPRYVTFTAPAVALLVGVLVAGLPRLLALVAVVALAAVAVPQLQADRQPRAKASSELGLAGALVARERSPGDGASGVLFGQYDGIAGMTTRVAAIAYPAPFRGLRDLRLRIPLDRSSSLWGVDRGARAAVDRSGGLRTVWILLDDDGSPQTPVPKDRLHALGFTETGAFAAPGSHLQRWTRVRAPSG